MLQLDAVKLDMPEIRKTLGEVGDSLDLAGMKTRLDELNEKITYVGGAVTGLYPNGAAASSHQTMDVDCVVEFYSFQQKEDFEY